MQESCNIVHIREKCFISKLQNTEKKTLLNIREKRTDCEVLFKKKKSCFPQPTFLVKSNILSQKILPKDLQ